MIEKINFPLIFLAYLTCLLYFCIWRFSWLILLIFMISCLLAFYRKYFLIFPILLVIASYLFFIKLDEEKQMKNPVTEIHQVSVIADSLEVNGNLLSFRGKSNGRTYQTYYTLKTKEEQDYFKQLNQNISIHFDGTLKIPEGQRNFNSFDYRKYLATQNIYQILTIESIKSIEVTSAWDLHLLHRKAILFAQNEFPAPMSSYMTGLLFGYLGKDFNQMGDIYSSLGIIHLFALSGMQVNFFIDWLRRILLRLGLRRDIVDKIQIPFSFFYAALTGWSISVLRSLFQKNIGTAGLKGLDNLSASFFALLLISPKFLLTVGGGLTMMYAFLLTMFTSYFKDLKGIKKTLLESSVLSFAVIPLLAFNFQVFQPISVLLTFAFSLIFDLFMLPALVLIFLLSLSTGFSLTINFLFIWLEMLIKFVDSIFHYPLVLGKPSLPFFLALIFTMGLLIDFYRNKKLAIWLVALLFSLFFLTKNPAESSITMIDVGQGDSFLLKDRFNKKIILIDTGGRLDFGEKEEWQIAQRDSNAERTLIPYLQSLGIGEIDVLIATHTDEDHVGDLVSLAKKVRIKQIWLSKGALSADKMLEALKEVNVPVHQVKVGEKIAIFDGYLQILSDGYTGKGDNDDSVVSYGKFYGKNFLFTGDLEEEGEEIFLKNYPDLKVDVLKAGHHGSKSSSNQTFIAALEPQIALISAGLNNRYHHPNQEVLDIFEENQTAIYRTDEQGAVKFLKKGSGWEIQIAK